MHFAARNKMSLNYWPKQAKGATLRKFARLFCGGCGKLDHQIRRIRQVQHLPDLGIQHIRVNRLAAQIGNPGFPLAALRIHRRELRLGISKLTPFRGLCLQPTGAMHRVPGKIRRNRQKYGRRNGRKDSAFQVAKQNSPRLKATRESVTTM